MTKNILAQRLVRAAVQRLGFMRCLAIPLTLLVLYGHVTYFDRRILDPPLLRGHGYELWIFDGAVDVREKADNWKTGANEWYFMLNPIVNWHECGVGTRTIT